MVLILAHHYDAEAEWLADRLVSAYGVATTLLAPEALGLDYSLTLQLRNSGHHQATIVLFETGQRLDGGKLTYLVNRLSYIDPLLWKQSAEKERQYATNEVNAFFPAFIESLACPVSNPIHHGSLYGDVQFALRWAKYARVHGIEVNALALDKTGKLVERLNDMPPDSLFRFLYMDRQIFQPVSQKKTASHAFLQKWLRQSGETETIELIFLRQQETFELLHVTKTPALSLYGEPFLQAFSRQLNQPV